MNSQTQHISPVPLPYGETFIEQGGYTYDNPYKFNGKELDEETRLYYYGARYYDPKVSLWLSVDPKIEYNKNQSPYVYTSSNPIVLLDPDGKDDFYFDFFWGTVTYIKNDKPNRYFITHHKFYFEKINDHSSWAVGSEEFNEQISINDYRLNGVRVNGKDVIQYILHANGSEEKYREVYFSLKSDLRPLMGKFCLGTAGLMTGGFLLESAAGTEGTSFLMDLNTTYGTTAARYGREALKYYSWGSTLYGSINDIRKGDIAKGLTHLGLSYSLSLPQWGITTGLTGSEQLLLSLDASAYFIQKQVNILVDKRVFDKYKTNDKNE